MEDEWSVYRSLVRCGWRSACGSSRRWARESRTLRRNEYAALLPQVEAQRRVFYQAMLDFEKSEIELRAAHDAAFGSQADE